MAKLRDTKDKDVEKSQGGDRRRVMILLGIGVGLLLAAFLLPKVLFGGNDEPATFDSSTPPVASSTPGAVVSPGGSPTGGSPTTTVPSDPLPESYEVFATRNPFTPLVAPATGGETGTTVPGGSGGTTNPPPPGSGTEPRVQQNIALLDASRGSDGASVATVTVDGVVYPVRADQIFATNYKVVSIDVSQGCASFLLGDDPFTLCVGEEIKK